MLLPSEPWGFSHPSLSPGDLGLTVRWALGSREEHAKEGLALGAPWDCGRGDAATFLQLSSSGREGPNRLEGLVWGTPGVPLLNSLGSLGTLNKQGEVWEGVLTTHHPARAEERKGVEVLPWTPSCIPARRSYVSRRLSGVGTLKATQFVAP